MQLIDVHCHVSPSNFPITPSTASREKWPCMQCRNDATGTLLFGDKVFRELDDRSWKSLRRIEYMDRYGVAIQVLSPRQELLSYYIEI